MKIGIVSNINGNHIRLERIIGNLLREKADGIVILGNLISPSGVNVDLDSDRRCIELMNSYECQFERSRVLKGRNERDRGNNATNSDARLDEELKLYPRSMTFEGRDSLYSFSFDYSGYDNIRPPIDFSDTFLRGLVQSLKSETERNSLLRRTGKEISVCFFGDSPAQQIFEVTQNKIHKNDKREVEVGNGIFYVVCPSTRDSGYCVFDETKFRLD